VRLYTPARNDTLYGSTELLNEFASTSPGAIASQWWGVWCTIRHYLACARVSSPDLPHADPAGCEDWYVGVTGFPRYLHELGLERRIRPQDERSELCKLFRWDADIFARNLCMLASALLFVLLRRRRPADLAIASLLVCALVFTASFFRDLRSPATIAICCFDLAALAGCLYCGVT